MGYHIFERVGGPGLMPKANESGPSPMDSQVGST